jgi:hypothetical protein
LRHNHNNKLFKTESKVKSYKIDGRRNVGRLRIRWDKNLTDGTVQYFGVDDDDDDDDDGFAFAAS